jgi:hypothetical protein
VRTNSENDGFIEPGLYGWWARGILVATVVVGLAGSLLFRKAVPTAIFVAVAMAAVMLGAFDSRGRFRWWGLVLTAGGAGILYRAWFHQELPPRLLLGLGIAFLLFLYAAGGAIGTVIGKARSRGSPS